MFPPTRIVCLTEETVETLYLLGEQDRIVGISGYVVRPPQARREKPRVSAFTSANIDKILALKPDLVLTFSDLQGSITAELIRRGLCPRLQSTDYCRHPRYGAGARGDGECEQVRRTARRNA
jgi:iron complex transport system substrate-binding protein